MSEVKPTATKKLKLKKAGRPKGGESDARQRLIDAARQLFIRLSYEKVSTRLVAERAGVNIALIRYYFKNKAGLLEAMLQDTLAPMREYVRTVVESGISADIPTKMRVYYQMMVPHPGFPHLIARLMDRPEGDEAREVLIKHMSTFILPIIRLTKSPISNLREDVDIELARLSCISLMICPFLLPEAAFKLLGFERNEASLMALLEHNIRILEHGILTQGEAEV
ncbi:TetR/AcrR family transcriptional regulator [Vibrio alginolyticus]